VSETHVLPQKVTLPMAEAFLALARDGAAPAAIDARAVQDLPAAFVLVLTALIRAKAETGERVTVIAPSAAFVDAFSDLGFFQDLMKMEFCQ
jgi:hypothetical protein